MQKRVGGLLIRNKKLLLVTGYGSEIYWSPGGKVDEEETLEEGLKREIKEELGIIVTEITPFYNHVTKPEYFNGKFFPSYESYYFLIKANGDITPKKEIEDYYWLGKEDINSPHLDNFYRDVIIKKLVENKLL